MAYRKFDDFRPGTNRKAERRRGWHLAFCRQALGRGDAWVTSTPNADICRIEVTPGSPWPAELRERGFPIEPDDPRSGERVIGHAIRETVYVNKDGTLSPLPEGAEGPTQTIDHAGIIKVLKYRFRAPF
jgi:hypothetical protein